MTTVEEYIKALPPGSPLGDFLRRNQKWMKGIWRRRVFPLPRFIAEERMQDMMLVALECMAHHYNDAGIRRAIDRASIRTGKASVRECATVKPMPDPEGYDPLNPNPDEEG